MALICGKNLQESIFRLPNGPKILHKKGTGIDKIVSIGGGNERPKREGLARK